MNKNYKLLKTLHLLSNNSRLSSKQIAKETNTTQQNASYLINKLNRDKGVNFQLLIIDTAKFALNNFIVLIRINQHSKLFVKQFINELKKYKEITIIETIFGNYDIMLRFTTKNSSSFNKLLKEILTTYKNSITNYQILTQIVEYIFPKNYLSKKKTEGKVLVSGDREFTRIDSTDKKIINILNQDSKINFSQVANQLNTTSKTIIERVKKLEKLHIIKGYSIVINHKKLNIYRYHISIKTRLEHTENEVNFKKFCSINPNITGIIKTFGNWDMIITIETTDEEIFKETLFTIKDKYANYIQDYEFNESIEIKKFKYIPELEI